MPRSVSCFNGTGRELLSNSIPCFPFCNVGGDGFVDVTGGSIKGGVGLAASLIADGAFATSDFDMTMAPIPEARAEIWPC